MFQKIPEQNAGKARNERTVETAMLVTANELLFWKYAKVYNIQHGNNITRALNINIELLQHYIPRNMVCVGYEVVSTMCKCGNK